MGNAWARRVDAEDRQGGRGVWNDRIRRFNRLILNPLMLRVADRLHGTYPAIVHHVGRRSGRTYRTPIVAQPIEGGFIIPLPYGADTDWCRNARAAGRFRIERGGASFAVADPAVVEPAAALPLVPARMRRAWSRLRIAAFLRVRAVPSAASAGASRPDHGVPEADARNADADAAGLRSGGAVKQKDDD